MCLIVMRAKCTRPVATWSTIAENFACLMHVEARSKRHDLRVGRTRPLNSQSDRSVASVDVSVGVFTAGRDYHKAPILGIDGNLHRLFHRDDPRQVSPGMIDGQVELPTNESRSNSDNGRKEVGHAPLALLREMEQGPTCVVRLRGPHSVTCFAVRREGLGRAGTRSQMLRPPRPRNTSPPRRRDRRTILCRLRHTTVRRWPVTKRL